MRTITRDELNALPDTTRVRITRTLIFEGPANWMGAQLDKSWLQIENEPVVTHGDTRFAETARVIEVVE